MCFPRLITAFGTILVLVCCYAFGVELVENSLDTKNRSWQHTQWIVEASQITAELEPAEWFTPLLRDTSIRWDLGLSSELRMRIRIQRDLPQGLGREPRPEDVLNSLEIGLGGRSGRAAAGNWNGTEFRQVLEPHFLPWIERIDDCRWIRSRDLVVLQVVLVDGLSEDTSRCLLGINTDAELKFMSRLSAEHPDWRVDEQNRYLITAFERIDLTQWLVEPLPLVSLSTTN